MKLSIKELKKQRWKKLKEFKEFKEKTQYPGVYILAYSNKKLKDRKIKINDIFYVGMSNSIEGVNNRLKDFWSGIHNDDVHSAARRFFKDFAKKTPYPKLKKRNGKEFFVSFLTSQCIVRKKKRKGKENDLVRGYDDLIIMGEVAKFEYEVIAEVLKNTKKEPDLNKK
jgi:hypothetical protein